jgi:dUTP pyrophosphatase
MQTLHIFKIHEQASLPTRATEQSACWDLFACLIDRTRIQVLDIYNQDSSRVVTNSQVTLYGGERMLVPTGLVFDIPVNYSLRLHPRSGLSWKKGISLVNCEGVIDSDYYHETFISLINLSDTDYVISHGDRIAQCELVLCEPFNISSIDYAPVPRTNRDGGFGSTG